ncbi:MAG: hypothetical protein MJ252_00165 [archaeon]|nr:hypothetical protein [archaeon]
MDDNNPLSEQNPNAEEADGAEEYEEEQPMDEEEKRKFENEESLRDFTKIIDTILLPLQTKDVVKKALRKFKDHINDSFLQITKNKTLEELKILETPELIKESHIPQLAQRVAQWTKQIDDAQKEFMEPSPGNTALEEIAHRKTKVSNCSIIAQQLRMDKFTNAIAVLEPTEEKSTGENFKKKINDFLKVYEDANDYLKFLQTLERSIKDISSDDLATIQHSIEGIYHNLKIIYMISKHKDANKFGRLLEIMAKEIWQKICSKIILSKLFKPDPEYIKESIELIDLAKNVATEWVDQYTRTKGLTKWEYSNILITERLIYTKEKCELLISACKKIQGYLKFLGHDLERVITGSSDKIYKEKEKVIKSYSYFEKMDCCIFDKTNATSVDAAFSNFETEMAELEKDTQLLIDDTFDHLKNAESAFDLYRGFDNLLTNDLKGIKDAMKNKYINILESFKSDVQKYYEIFKANKDNPPISKAKSLVAGKIAWARQIYVKMKRPISKIYQEKDKSFTVEDKNDRNVDEKLKKERELAREFLKVAKELREYENQIYNDWSQNSLSNFMDYLRDHILTDRTDKELKEEEEQKQKEKGKSKKDKAKAAKEALKKLKESQRKLEEAKIVDGKMPQREYRVRFRNELKLMIRDTKFLDLYGFSNIPPNIINIAHQETQLAKYCNILNLMLKDYQNLTKSMKTHHRLLLQADCNELLEKIRVGTNTHNWTALGIEEFYRDCMIGIKTLRDKFSNVIKGEDKINSLVRQIKNSTLVKPFDKTNTDCKELSTFVFAYEDHRQKVLGELLNKYQEITMALIDIERLTFDTSKEDTAPTQKKTANLLENYGKREEMQSYYQYWEKCILDALSKCIYKSIITFNELFSLNSDAKDRFLRQKMMDTSKKGKLKNALFAVKSKFHTSKDISYIPEINEIDLEIKQKLLFSFQFSAKEFIRWMRGTCKAPSLDTREEKEREYIKKFYSYGTELEDDSSLKSIILNCLDTVGHISDNLTKNKDTYTKIYQDEYFGHWGQGKQGRGKSFSELEKNMTLKNFENKINEIIPQMEAFIKKNQTKKLCDGNFIINNEDLILKGEEQIKKVIDDILKILAKDLEEKDMKKFEQIIKTNKEKLLEKTDSSDDLKKVLGYVSKILNKKLSMELKIHGMEEKIHFLKLHKYSLLEPLEEKFEILKKEWDNLRVKAKRKDDNLLERKRNLSKKTEEEEAALAEEVKTEYANYKKEGPLSDIPLDQGYEVLLKSREKLKQLDARKKDIVDSQKLFNLPITTFPEINEMIDSNNKIEIIYKTYHDFNNFYTEQQNMVWNNIDKEALEKMVDELKSKRREFERKHLQSTLPYGKFEDIRNKYEENIKLIIVPLKSPVINERNFDDFIMDIRGGIIKINFAVTTLKDILDLDLLPDHEKVGNMVADAEKESQIREKLNSIKDSLDKMSFQMGIHKRGNEDKGYKIKDVSEEMDILKDCIQDLQSLGSNKHAKAFKEEITDLEQELNNILEIIEILIEAQKKWIYLEAIFVGSDDIRQKLQKETQEFDDNNKKFTQMMEKFYKKPSIRIQCKESGRKMELKKFLTNFEQAEKSLTAHLDSKKNEFSRFYFLTEQDLLQILGSADPLETLNPHLIKIYTNCKRLLSDHRNITGMVSQEGEQYYFEKPIRIESQQAVGQFMNKVDDAMKSTLKSFTKQGIQDYTKEELIKFVHNKLGMVCAFVTESWWCFAILDVFRRIKQEGDKYAMKNELERQSQGLLDLVKCVRNKDIDKNDRLKLNNLIIRTVHGREIVDQFVRDSILDAREFEWDSQLKFIWDKEKDDLVISQCNYDFFSCYEYQGLEGRLVVTPLTDRCILTITTALGFFNGTAPAGPAGTGKTETVKDLGRGMGIRVVVQNCSDTLDYIFMGQFFSGLSQTGFWGCFDEFNMINREVLSVVTTQINSIQQSLAQHKESWFLMNREVKLLPTIGIFITMNPNYEGRSELPDNLKALFRPVTMVVPCYSMICENILLSFGFEEGTKLATKIDKIYNLSKEQLSKQHHYEWGLRSMKAVLNSAGALKREDTKGLSEDLIFLKAMKDLNMPKFIKDDANLFEGLLQDLFPNIDNSLIANNEDTDIREVIESLKFMKNEMQILKVLQMYEVMNIRHCTMICGPPQTGKSTIIEILKGTFEKRRAKDGVNANVIEYLINPKAQSVPRLFGKKNEISDDFEIGILSNIFQIANQPIPNNKNELRWIILDGDVDPLWIEKLNSVMDDSKTLTLENKDRILMQKYCSMLVEAYNIEHASPATISRLGMIYVDPVMLQGDAVFYRWLENKNKEEWDEQIRTYMTDSYNRIMPAALKYILKGAKGNEEEGTPFKLIAPQYQASMVNQLCNLIDACLYGLDQIPTESSQLESLFIFCVVWSVGACLTTKEDKDAFAKFIKDLPSGTSTPPSKPFDNFWDISGGRFVEWNHESLNGRFIPETTGVGEAYNNIIIPTADTKKYSFLIRSLVQIEKPVLFVGESGTGKTVTIQNYIKDLTKERTNPYIICAMNFSSRTSGTDFQNTMEEILETRFLRTMGPPSGKKLIIYADDLGMPTVDRFGTQQPIAFMKLLIEKNCYYTKDNKDLIKLIDTNFIGSTLPPGNGNNNIDPRFISLFNVFNITIEDSAIRDIYFIILGNFLEQYGSDEIMSMREKIMDATIQLFTSVKADLPRTPIKFHYVFNIRDVSKVFQGFCLLTKEAFPTKESLIKLWKHECLRVFSDKLREVSDQQKVQQSLENIIRSNFSDYGIEDILALPNLHADFMKVNFDEEDVDSATGQPKEDVRRYENIDSYEKAKEFFKKTLEAMKEFQGVTMNLEFYDDCIEHLLRIHRILRFQNGNALLVGVGGSGKQSLTKLATYIAKYELWGIKISSKFEEKHLREQLLQLFTKFIELKPMKPITFLFTDEQILDEGFLELINNILTTGIVPAIFEKGDKNNIIELYKPLAQKKGLGDSKDVAYNLYVSKVRENLHMVLSMSPSGDNLRKRCRNFPGLISSTTIDWFFEWPKEALLQVANNLFSEYKEINAEILPTICEHCIEVHMSLSEFSAEALKSQKRHIYTTPKSFLDFINNFKNLYKKHNENSVALVNRLEGGLTVIAKSSEDINQLREQVEKEEAKCAEMSAFLQTVLDDLNKVSAETGEKKAAAEASEKDLTEKGKIIDKEKKEIETKAAAIAKLIDKIRKDVDEIDKGDVDMFGKMATFDPSNPTHIVVKSIAYSLSTKKSSYNNFSDSEVKGVFARSGELFAKMKDLEKTFADIRKGVGNIDQCKTARDKVTPLSIDAKNKSSNQLRNYVINFCKFVESRLEKAILDEKLEVKIKDKEEAETQLAETKANLAKLTAELNRLNADKEVKEKEYNETKENLAFLGRRLATARDLFTGLTGEQKRWAEDKVKLEANKEKLIGDCLLGSSFLSYCGPFSFDFRKRMIYETWKEDLKTRNIAVNENFSVQELLTSDQQISQWNIDGLPDDELSIQNGILTENASRYPLAIDPENQAIIWLRKKGGLSLKVITFNMENYMKAVNLSVRNGGVILVENVGENIDPNINPVLEKNYIIKNQMKYLILDNQEVNVSDDFKLFLITKLANPHYTPEIMAKATVINFSITMDGLEEQLLNEVVRHELPHIEESRKKLVEDMNKNKIILKNCEDNLLNALNSNGEGNILENYKLIDTLKETKDKAQQLKADLQTSEEQKKELYEQRDNYIPVAKRGAILYFSISGLRLIGSMYEYSLASYYGVYKKSIEDAAKDMILNNRLDKIKKKLTSYLYEYICLSLFGRHKLMFSFHMRTMIMRYEEDLDMNELLFFIRGSIQESKTKKPEELDWVSDATWQDLEGMSLLNEVMKGAAMAFKSKPEEWKEWYDLEKPEDAPLPGELDFKLTPIEKLCVIRVFRQDRVYNAIKNFIKTTTGGVETYITPPPMKMEKIFAQTSTNTPALFILTPGVDPAFFINSFAVSQGYFEKKFRSMSLGQKQEVEATNMITDGIKRGLWILLQNCDLLFNWLKDLESIIDKIDSLKPKPEFRLWLTTSPIDNFPMGILHKSFKVVTEAPDGLQPNMGRVFGSIKEEEFESDSTHAAYKPLVFVISFFHSVMQDRKKYGKIGWNVIYDFMESDFIISKRLLAMYLNKIGPDDAIPWASLKYLIGEAMYGGRVTDDYDRRIMMTYLNEYMGDFVFDANQKFYFAKGDFNYEIPELGPLDVYTKAIDNFPQTYSPEVIGLHSNAEIDYFTQASKRIWENMIKLQSSSGGGSSSKKKDENAAPTKTKEETVLEMAEMFLNSKIPPKFDMLAINRKFTAKTPIEAVLTQEIERYNILNDRIIITLDDLIHSLKGEIAMNAEIESVMNSLYNGILPKQWRQLAPETEKNLLNWLDHFNKRYIQYKDWLEKGEPKSMWLSGLHIPASYLKAIIQTTCRKKVWPLDKVSTYTTVSKMISPDEVQDKPEYGCYIHGMYLEGAEWNIEQGRLERQLPKKLICNMPLIQVIPAETSKIKLRNNFKTPVYMTQNRNNIKGEGFVFEADLKTFVHPNLWVLQGVAMVLNTVYG